MTKLDRSHWQLLAALKNKHTLSAAAETLYITQAAASQRLREAERRLGVELVTRQGKSLKLNAAGMRLARSGEQLEQQLNAAETDAIWLSQRTRKRLRLAQHYHDDPNWICQLTQLCTQPPFECDLEVVRCGNRSPEQLILADEADIALSPELITVSGVRVKPLLADHLVAVVHRDSPLAQLTHLHPSDFMQQTYLTYSLLPRVGHEYECFFKRQNAYPAHIIKVESTQAILSLISHGYGVSILPSLMCRPHPNNPNLKMVHLAGEEIPLTWFALSPEQPVAIEHIEQFWEQVCTEVMPTHCMQC